MDSPIPRSILTGVLVGCLVAATVQNASAQLPWRTEDLHAIERSVRATVQQSMPSVVAIHLKAGIGSGVVISNDGYIITAKHVVEEIGSPLRITFMDGRSVNGVTVGTLADLDGALVKIIEPGFWPASPIASHSERPHTGDWCIAMGHPGGFDPNRSPPVRVGRITKANRYGLRSDCIIAPGDSGGPLFDIEGRVIGIHTRVGTSPVHNTHLPMYPFEKCIPQMKEGIDAKAMPGSLFLSRFDINEDGVVELRELENRPEYSICKRLFERFKLDPSGSHAIDELRAKLGMNVASDRRDITLDAMFIGTLPSTWGQLLEREFFTRGKAIRQACEELALRKRDSVVKIRHGEDLVGYGTIVDARGWFVCKWSDIKRYGSVSTLTFSTPTDNDFAVRHVTSLTNLDLAFMQMIDAESVSAVDLDGNDRLDCGQWLACVGHKQLPLSIGVVSVKARKIPAPPGYIGVTGADTENGALVRMLTVGSAAEGRLFTDDIITQVGPHAIRSFADLVKRMRQFRPGDTVHLAVQRQGHSVPVRVTLGKHPRVTRIEEDEVTGRLSDRRDDIAHAFQHDCVIAANQCGTPVFDLTGNFQGINIAKASRLSMLAIPSHVVKTELKRILAEDSRVAP